VGTWHTERVFDAYGCMYDGVPKDISIFPGAEAPFFPIPGPLEGDGKTSLVRIAFRALQMLTTECGL
jgi:hypothetical protein